MSNAMFLIMPFYVRFIVLVSLICFCTSNLFAQSGKEPYENILSPLALADLDSSSLSPLQYVTGHGLPSAKDSLGANILVADTGIGVISYLWAAVPETDSTTWVRLWIDDTLVREGTAKHFFTGEDTGSFLRDFDSTASGAYDCDVQLPFQKNFRITYTSPLGNVWYAIAWRPLPKNSVPISTNLTDSNLLKSEMEAGAIANKRSWETKEGHREDTTVLLPAGAGETLWTLAGPSTLTSLDFRPSDSTDRWDSLWVQIFWNGSDSAAVDAPLADFLGQGAGMVSFNAIPMWSIADSGFGCSFPMPFEYSAKIVLLNLSSVPLSISAGVKFEDTSLSWNTTGYFHAYFSESNPTRYGVFHPVLHWKGPGRFVGMNMAIPNNPYPCALEGDAVFNIDSTPSLGFRYTGTEDYFGGGFYFSDGPYTHPFSGCTQKWYSFYRFHILDAVDFKKSIDFDFQHGNNNDVYCDYRTVAYFYAPWTQAWVRCDTVTFGKEFMLYGSSYPPQTSLNVKIGNQKVARFSTGSGNFRVPITVPPEFQIGNYPLYVGGVQCCILCLLAHPSIRIVADSSNLSVSPGDSITLSGWGFDTSAKPLFEISGKRLQVLSMTIDSLGRMHATIVVPILAPGSYTMRAQVGSQSWDAENLLVISPRLWTEAEDLIIDSTFDGEISQLNLCPWWNAQWSKQEVLYFIPDSASAFFIVEFNILQTGDYSMIVHGTQGQGFGNYQLILDAADTGYLAGTSTTYPPNPAIMDSIVVHLDSGRHRMRMQFLDANGAPTSGLIPRGSLWLDALEFEPISPTELVPQLDSAQPSFFQDPASETVSIDYGQNFQHPAPLELYDIVGRPLNIQVAPSNTSESFSTTRLASGVYFLKAQDRIFKIVIAH